MRSGAVSEALLLNRILAAAVGSVSTAVGVSTVWYAHQKLSLHGGGPPMALVAVLLVLPLTPAYVYAWRRWHDSSSSS